MPSCPFASSPPARYSPWRGRGPRPLALIAPLPLYGHETPWCDHHPFLLWADAMSADRAGRDHHCCCFSHPDVPPSLPPLAPHKSHAASGRSLDLERGGPGLRPAGGKRPPGPSTPNSLYSTPTDNGGGRSFFRVLPNDDIPGPRARTVTETVSKV